MSVVHNFVLWLFVLLILSGATATDKLSAKKVVMEYLVNLPGQGILAGQEENNSSSDSQMEKLIRITGKSPALRGFETAAYSKDPMAEAIKSWKNGQLVTFGYHMGAPPLSDDEFNHSKGTSDITNCLTPGTDEYASFNEKLAQMATRLEGLRDKGIPVLWRPFHEMDGTWFWWSKEGCEPYKKLWVYMYDYFTETMKLNNLIWVWSASYEPESCWYPGDEYVDIIGSDVYLKKRDNDRWTEIFNQLKKMESNKPVALTENDLIPHPEVLIERDLNYIWFLTWHSRWLDSNEPAFLKMVYQHDYVITADELPDFSK